MFVMVVSQRFTDITSKSVEQLLGSSDGPAFGGEICFVTIVTPPRSTFFIERTENLSMAAKMLVQFFHDFVFALLFDDLI